MPQVNYDNKGSYQGTSANPQWQHVTGVGAKIMYVTMAVESNVGISGIDYDGVAMSNVDIQTSSNPRAEVWKLVNPHQGDNLVDVTMAGSVCGVWGSFTLFDVDVNTGEISLLKGSGATGTRSINVLTVPTGGMAFDLVAIRNYANWTGGSGQTMINRLVQSCSYNNGHWNSYEAGSGTINMDSGWNNTTDNAYMAWGLGPGTPSGNQVIMVASKIQELYKEMKLGRAPKDDIIRRYRELMNTMRPVEGIA